MRVLVIDDEPALRQVIRRMLEPAGHEVVEAQNGRVGAQAFHAAPFDVVLTDIIMPEQEGMETISEMRKLNKSVRIVAMSGGGIKDLDVLLLARRLGADATLTKPFRKDDLLACVEGRAAGPTEPRP
jgi:two-component system, chemotaxis family, chemotaxis protein CheY